MGSPGRRQALPARPHLEVIRPLRRRWRCVVGISAFPDLVVVIGIARGGVFLVDRYGTYTIIFSFGCLGSWAVMELPCNSLPLQPQLPLQASCRLRLYSAERGGTLQRQQGEEEQCIGEANSCSFAIQFRLIHYALTTGLPDYGVLELLDWWLYNSWIG